jgi:hypothetical protein
MNYVKKQKGANKVITKQFLKIAERLSVKFLTSILDRSVGIEVKIFLIVMEART